MTKGGMERHPINLMIRLSFPEENPRLYPEESILLTKRIYFWVYWGKEDLHARLSGERKKCPRSHTEDMWALWGLI